MTYKIDTFVPKLNEMKQVEVIHCVNFFPEKIIIWTFRSI